MKQLFKNYNFEFDKNEKKILINFCKQALKQMEGDSRYFSDVRAYNSIIGKLNESTESVKFTKDELNRLTLQLKENIKFLQKKMEKSWFLKKWLYKSVLLQYKNLLSSHFNS